MAEPTVDILMATYNGERFVGEQIESIQAQTYGKWRLLVSDDCSSDGTLDVVRRYAAGDERIRIVSEGVRYGGAKENFFALMGKYEAPYAMFCDQDDVWLPEKVEKSLTAMRALEEEHSVAVPLLVFCDMKVVDSELNVIHESFEKSSRFDPSRLAFPQLAALNVAAGCCQCFNEKLVETCLACADATDIEIHDWWTMLVASALGAISYIDEPLSLYRQHGQNEVGANDFNPVGRASDQNFMEEQFRAAIAQVALFCETYEEHMSENDKSAAKSFASVVDAKTCMGGVVQLMRSRCLKPGIRKLGQFAMVVRVANANRVSGEAL